MMLRRITAALLIVAAGCASEPPSTGQPVAILDRPPARAYQPVWPIWARAEAKAGKAALDQKLREEAREVGADAVIIEQRYLDPAAAGDEREIGLGDPYPELLESLEPGAFPHAAAGMSVHGPYVIAEGLAIRYGAAKPR